MAITYKQYGGGSSSDITPEERQLKNERTRIESMIRSYERNPDNYNPRMVASLERMATQYGLMFNRVEPEASTGAKVMAGVGGFADAILMDLIPDSIYSDDSTTDIRNKAKMVGTGASFLLGTGLASAGVRTAAKLGAKGATALAAKQATRAAAKKSSKEVAEEAAKSQAKRARQGDVGVAGEKVGESIGGAVSGGGARKAAGEAFDNIDSNAIKNAAKKLEDSEVAKGQAFGFDLKNAGAPAALGNMAKKNISEGLTDIGQAQGFKWAQNALSKNVIKVIEDNPMSGAEITKLIKGHKLTKDQILDITKAISTKHGANSAYGKSLIAKVKGASKDIDLDPESILKIVQNIGPKMDIANKANVTKVIQNAGFKFNKAGNGAGDEVLELLNKAKLIGKDKKISNVIEYLEQAAKPVDPMSIMAAAQKNAKQLGIEAAQAYGSVKAALPSSLPFGGQDKTRAELEEEMYDPFNAPAQ